MGRPPHDGDRRGAAGDAAPDRILPWIEQHTALFIVGAVALVLAFRGLFLLRFGDGSWMNWSYVAHAKTFALRGALGTEEPPLTPRLLAAFRSLGLGPLGALDAIYLLAHLLLVLGTLGLGTYLWPAASARRRGLLAVVVAVTPLLSTVGGYRNVGVLLGAATLAGALGLALSALVRPRTAALRLAGALALAVLAGWTRFEALAGVAAGGVVLLALGPALPGTSRARLAGILLLCGALAGHASAGALRRATAATSSDYAFYTFYDGLPFLMWPNSAVDGDEFGRYRASIWYFGSYAENRGSIARALLNNPRAAVLRIGTKLVDMAGALAWIGSLTPIGLYLVWVGLRRRREPAGPGAAGRRGWAFLAFAAPAAVLWVPAASPPYFLTVLPPLLLAATRGLDLVTARVAPTALARLAAAGVVGSALLVALVGRTDVSNSPALIDAARYLEVRCRDGCLTNLLPQALRYQAWVDLEAGSPLPRPDRSERRVLGQYDAEYERAFLFRDRVERARRAGFRGPVLHVEAEIASFPAFHPVFDRELALQGEVDLSGARVERTFQHGRDRVVIRVLDDGATPRAAQGAGTTR
jgi:hypothetical protein